MKKTDSVSWQKESSHLPPGIVFFDGVCTLCGGVVDVIAKMDSKKKLAFATLQGETAERLNVGLPRTEGDPGTVVFLRNASRRDEKTYTQSNAILEICRELGGMWRLFYGLRIVPEFIRDGIYSWIAGNRYKWFGKADQCAVPAESRNGRFLP